MIGQVFVGLQPSRGIHEDPEKSLHDRSLLPTHQYTAFYQWIREQFQADAIVHIGTHGTLEFQRGKRPLCLGTVYRMIYSGICQICTTIT